MDMLTSWPMMVAGVLATAGAAAAWWYTKQRATPMRTMRMMANEAQQSTLVARAATSGKSRSAKRGAAKSAEDLDTLIGWQPMATRVLTSPERQAYHVLRKALPEHMILAQVPVARFIKVPTENSYNEWLRRVGSLCADLVVCDSNSQAIAVVEVRQPFANENDRAKRRHARMDRVLKAANIPVHVWLEGALPGPVVAREAVLGALLPAGLGEAHELHQARRDAEAAAVVAAMQSPVGAMKGMVAQEAPEDFNFHQWVENNESGDGDGDGERKEPPPSTWFDDLDSAPTPLDQVPARMH
jgi:Protein of unknown function (DUF2726)